MHFAYRVPNPGHHAIRSVSPLVRLVVTMTVLVTALVSLEAFAWAEPKTIWVLLDTSKSMNGPNRGGRCGPSCQPCAKDADCNKTMGPDFECFTRRGVCRVRSGLEPDYCSKKWERVKGHLEEYLKSLKSNPGDELALYTLTDGHRAELKMDETVPQESGDWMRKVERASRALKTNADCTFLFDSIFDLLEKEGYVECTKEKGCFVRTEGLPNRRRVLHVFTDGVDEGSHKTAADLKALLNQIEANGDHWIWQGPKHPVVCPPGDLHCPGDGPIKFDPGRVRVEVGPATGPLTLFGKEVNRKLNVVEETRSMFPWELAISFTPDAQSKDFLRLVPPEKLVNRFTNTALVFQLESDLGRARPSKVGGTLTIRKRDGIVELVTEEIPISFAVRPGLMKPPNVKKSAAGYPLPPTHCPGAYDHSLQLFPVQADLLTNGRGVDKVEWVVTTKGALADDWSASFAGGRLNLKWDAPPPTKPPRRSEREVRIRDRNGWIQTAPLVVPVEPKPGDSCFREQQCDDVDDNDQDGKTDCDDPDCATDPACQSSGLGWLLILLALIAAAAAFFLRKPDMERLFLRVQWPDEEDPQRTRLCDNQLARFGKPLGRSFKGSRLADAAEWHRALSPEDEEGEGETEKATEADGLSHVIPKLTVHVVDGEVRLQAPDPVFVREPHADGQEPRDQVVVAKIEGSRVRPTGKYRVRGAATVWGAEWRGDR